MERAIRSSRGPFRADQVHQGDPYELSDGHAVYCSPTGSIASKAKLLGGAVLGTDPDVTSAGVDAGFSPEPGTLRAPDVAVGGLPDAHGWAPGAPPLAVEYAATGQDEAELQQKIRDLITAGTRHIWVVRLVGPRRVEVYEPEKPARIANPGEALLAPGVLRNPVQVEALYDPSVANEAVLRNLLQRHGYESLDAVRLEGEAEGKAEGKAEGRAEGKAEGRAEGKAEGLALALLGVLAARGLALDEAQRASVDGCRDAEALQRWLARAAVATTAADILD